MDFTLVILLGATMALLFAFVYAKEVAVNKKMKLYERSFDILNQHIHRLEKELKMKAEADEEEVRLDDEYAKAEDKGRDEFKEAIAAKLNELIKDNLEFKRAMMEKYADLENKLRPMTSVATGSTALDETKIVTLFSNGMSREEIAKQMRIGTGEVELVLKLHDLK